MAARQEQIEVGAGYQDNTTVAFLLEHAAFLLNHCRLSFLQEQGQLDTGTGGGWAEVAEPNAADERVRDLEERERRLAAQVTELRHDMSRLQQENIELKARPPSAPFPPWAGLSEGAALVASAPTGTSPASFRGRAGGLFYCIWDCLSSPSPPLLQFLSSAATSSLFHTFPPPGSPSRSPSPMLLPPLNPIPYLPRLQPPLAQFTKATPVS